MRTSTAPFLSFYMLRGRRRLRTVRASTAPFLFASLDLLNSIARRHLRASTAANFGASTAILASLDLLNRLARRHPRASTAANFSATTATFSSLNVKLT